MLHVCTSTVHACSDDWLRKGGGWTPLRRTVLEGFKNSISYIG